MRRYLYNAPWWAWSMLNGAVFAVCAIAAFKVVGESWSGAVVFGVTMGVLLGAISGPFSARAMQRTREAVGPEPLARDQMRLAGRAALRGPAPADPAVRAVAARLAAQQRDQTTRLRPWLVTGSAALLALFVYLALTSPPTWWWAGAALYAALTGSSLALPRRFRQRVALLEDRGPEAH